MLSKIYKCLLKEGVPLVVILFLFDLPLVKAQTDSVRYLQEVQVKTTSMPEILNTSTTVQTLNSASLKRIQALQLSDAVKHFAGITIKDYGGIGGLKTVSVRGLGANHTAFDYDGITITDSQSGQIDLSKFSMNNVDQVSLANGNPDNMLNPARAFASGSLLSVRSTEPSFAASRKMKTTIHIKAGSFGLIAPAFTMYNKISQRVTSSFLIEGQDANGKYPYILDYGGITSHEKRQNTDVTTLHLEENIFYKSQRLSKISSKIYYYQSERGLPGATIYYNPHSSQRLWEKNLFLQSRYEKSITKRIETLFSAKYSTGYLRYLDPDYLGTAGKLENIYHQQEAYISAASVWKALRPLQFSLAMDGFYNVLDATLYQFPHPSRYTWLTAVNGKWNDEHVNIQLGVVNTVVDEHIENGIAPDNHTKLSPSVNIGYKLLDDDRLIFRFFYKDIFRMPTFNDLYYTGIGNKTLKPENAHQFNLGVAYTFTTEKKATYITCSVDVYHNKITDKIVALPTKNIFIWSMINVGIVNINGSDLALKIGRTMNASLSVGFEGTYTYQQVLDVTDPESKTYKNQIAYTPVHSGSGVLHANTPFVDVAYNFLFSGQRYTLNHNIPPNLLKGYMEHGITLSRGFTIHQTAGKISMDVLNLLNTQYEVIRNFPMPGRSFRIGISIKF